MLERRIATGGIAYYASPLLAARGIAHAFSTRLGGVSPSPFDSMNLGNPNGCDIQDDTEHIRENYRRLQNAMGCGEAILCRVHQVHGRAVVRLRTGEPFDTSLKADGIVSDDPTRVASVRIADCVPVLLAGDDGRVVAAVHAGWRGVIAGVATAALHEMRMPSNAIVAAIGPCISGDAFEVGPEVAAEFDRVFGKDSGLIKPGDGDRFLVDLPRAITTQLVAGGINVARIDRTDRCTFRDHDEFFSHRRDKGITGRMAALICARGASN